MLITRGFLRERIRSKAGGGSRLSEQMGYSAATVSNWLNGRSSPGLYDIWQMASLLHLNPHDLVEFFLYLDEKRHGKFRFCLQRYREFADDEE